MSLLNTRSIEPAAFEILSADAPDIPAADYLMARDMAEALHSAYPGHFWAVTAEGKKGICTIFNMQLSGNMGYVLHIPKQYSASDFKKNVIMAGGEILERYKQRRGAVDHAAIVAIPKKLGIKVYER